MKSYLQQVAIYHRAAVADPGALRKLADCQHYCLSKLGGLGVVFDDTGHLSGLSLKRPALHSLTKQLLADSTKIIVIYDLDALSRDLVDLAYLAEILQQASVDVHVVKLGGPIKYTAMLTHNIVDEQQNLLGTRLKAGRERAKSAREGRGQNPSRA
jgi:DNA invertase Pin-like site-specific DNA recombinase